MLKPGDTAQVITSFSDIHEHTDDLKTIKRRDSQLLFGEKFRIEKIEGAWVYGESLNDGYKGYVTYDHLAPANQKSTHIVFHILTHIYEVPDFKTRPLIAIGFKSEIFCSGKRENGFAEIPGFGWVPESHIILIGSAKSPIDLAVRFIGHPYLYGGRSALGLDCSGLVQLVLQACGKHCPRDSDQQVKFGESVEHGDIRRGDLVFFAGHVGIMVDQNKILNANARTMDTRVEILDDLEKIYKGITDIRRL